MTKNHTRKWYCVSNNYWVV